MMHKPLAGWKNGVLTQVSTSPARSQPASMASRCSVLEPEELGTTIVVEVRPNGGR